VRAAADERRGTVEGKAAIVTGGGSGIGRATALLFAREGAAVTICGRERSSVDQTASEIEGAGGRVLAVQCDVGSPEQVDRMVQATLEAFDGIDILVNNAAWDPYAPLLETSIEAWQQCLSTNLTGTFLCARAVVPHMAARGGGSIVNTSSVLALGSLPRSGAYIATKAAILGLTRSMVVEWTELGIRVNCILPGSTDTDMMWLGLRPEEIPAEREASAGVIPMRRIADPEEIAQATLWLCGPGASFAAGAFLVVDGGLTAKSPSPR
jgi:NAD(P)-dependent dehydrogenase (short-subunit alcohol dehydrogenase family)